MDIIMLVVVAIGAIAASIAVFLAYNDNKIGEWLNKNQDKDQNNIRYEHRKTNY